MSDYKLLKEAYSDNTGYIEKYRENFNSSVRTTPAADNERGTIFLSNPNSNTSTSAKYRVIRQDPNDSSLYDIAVNFEKTVSDVTSDIKNIFRELCIFPSSSFSRTKSEKNYIVSFQNGDTVNFLHPKQYGTMIQGGIYDKQVVISKVSNHIIMHNGKEYSVNTLNPITITIFNPTTCNSLDRDISNNSNTKDMTFIYKKVPLLRLTKQS